MSHSDTIQTLPTGCLFGHTDDVKNAAYRIEAKRPMPFSLHLKYIIPLMVSSCWKTFESPLLELLWIDTQFICRDDHCSIAKSNRRGSCCFGSFGRVDSTVAAMLLHKAIGPLRCIFVNNGLLRKNEFTDV